VMEGPIDHIDSDAFYYDIDTLAEIDQLRETNVVDHAMNVYFTENLANENGSFCGISSFTWSPHQGVVIMNACIPSIWNPSTFSHEVGHYFDLFHTHETAYGRECVDGSNCGTAGDRLCDTPADPGLNRCGPNGNDYCVDPYCVYTGAFVDPCHGDPNHPATDNMLAYSRPTCRTVFTPQQSEKAAATLVNLRPDHILDTSGAEEWTGSGQESGASPLLHVAVRSPVSRTIACRIAIAEDRAVTARLVDASGRTVAQLTSADETMPAGTHDLFWDVGGRLPSGIYFLQVEARPAWQGPTKAAKVSRPIVVVR
ncbi:MAG: M43 family zinc metalloprotease, partial [Candidatus Eisenbacteria bacterium]|nr:M43 family zinc metalloprotease [Candidatus Eisenbacteria bacterium]